MTRKRHRLTEFLSNWFRRLRGIWRRRFYPNGPAWFKDRISSELLIMGLRGCTKEEAAERQAVLDASRLTVWLEGY